MKPYFLPWQAKAMLVCVSTYSDENECKTWFFNHPSAEKSPRECIRELQEYLDQFERVIAHNFKFDYQWLTDIGLDLSKHKLYCTMVAEYLIRGHEKLDGLSLDDLGLYYNIPLKKDKVNIYWDAGVNTPDIPAEILQPYCEQDAVNALAIYRRQWKQLLKLGLAKLFALEMQALPAYADMERNGMRVDIEKLEKHQAEYRATLDKMDERLCELLHIDNAGSGAQLSAGLFGGQIKYDERQPIMNEDGTPSLFKTGKKVGEQRYQKKEIVRDVTGIGLIPEQYGIAETKISGVYETNVDALKRITIPKRTKTRQQEIQQEVLRLLFERSRTSQMLSTYFDGLLNIQVDEYVHPTINQALTKTGRTSCKKPNLQNQPRGNTGPVKECFITRY